MTIHRILITKFTESELAIELDADDAPEAERLARERVPEDGREWTVVNSETHVRAEAVRGS
ncbi:MAG TPA: hypothetical protein VGK73_19140 [Polyangiaceae bacterium]